MTDAEPKPRKSVSCHNPWCGGSSLCSYCDPKPKPVGSISNPSGDADVREKVKALLITESQAGFGCVDGHEWEWCEKDFVAVSEALTDVILALTGNASTDRAGTQACKAEVSSNLQTPLQGGGEASIRAAIELALDRNGLAEAGWSEADIDDAVATVTVRSEFSRKEAAVIMPIVLAALKPQTPDESWQATIDRIIPALPPVTYSEEVVTEWAVWKDRERIRADLSALATPPGEREGRDRKSHIGTTSRVYDGDRHTSLMDAIHADLVRQCPESFTEEDGNSTLAIPVPKAFLTIDVSALAETCLPALAARPSQSDEGEKT